MQHRGTQNHKNSPNAIGRSNTMPKLNYLFIAEYIDGTLFKQTPEDISTIDPLRNCYYDVLQSGKKIRRFSVVGKGNQITVDLGNGVFYVNGLPVLLESEKLPCLPDKFELIWFHRVNQSINITGEVQEDLSIKETKREPQPEHREYFIGWKCNIKGKSYQQKIGVA